MNGSSWKKMVKTNPFQENVVFLQSVNCQLITTLMKKLFLLLVAALTIVGCATSEERAARQAEHMEKVKAAVDGQQYKINMREMIPLRSSSIPLSGMNYLKVNGNEVSTDLPYLGRDDIPHFKTRGELRIDSRIQIRTQMEGYNLALIPKEKSGLITFSARNRGENCSFNIRIFSDGHVKVTLRPEKRDEISYEGYVEPSK